jgi:hypothetical protein
MCFGHHPHPGHEAASQIWLHRTVGAWIGLALLAAALAAVLYRSRQVWLPAVDDRWRAVRYGSAYDRYGGAEEDVDVGRRLVTLQNGKGMAFSKLGTGREQPHALPTGPGPGAAPDAQPDLEWGTMGDSNSRRCALVNVASHSTLVGAPGMNDAHAADAFRGSSRAETDESGAGGGGLLPLLANTANGRLSVAALSAEEASSDVEHRSS